MSERLKIKLFVRMLQCTKPTFEAQFLLMISFKSVGSATLIVYTIHFIRARPNFQEREPSLSVLGLPLEQVRAGVKFWFGYQKHCFDTDVAKSFTRTFFEGESGGLFSEFYSRRIKNAQEQESARPCQHKQQCPEGRVKIKDKTSKQTNKRKNQRTDLFTNRNNSLCVRL